MKLFKGIACASALVVSACGPSLSSSMGSGGVVEHFGLTNVMKTVACAGGRELFAYADGEAGHAFSRVKVASDGTLTVVSAAQVVDRFSEDPEREWLWRDGDRAYTRHRSRRYVYDISQDVPVLVGEQLRTVGEIGAFLGGHKVLLTGDPAFMYDLTDPENPVELRRIRVRTGNTVGGVKLATRVGDKVVLLATDDRTVLTVDVAALLALPAGGDPIVDDHATVLKTTTRIPRSGLFEHRGLAVFNVRMESRNTENVSRFSDDPNAIPWVGLLDPATGQFLIDASPDGTKHNGAGFPFPFRLISRGGELINFEVNGVTSAWASYLSGTDNAPSQRVPVANLDRLKTGVIDPFLWEPAWFELPASSADRGQAHRFEQACWDPATSLGVLVSVQLDGEQMGVYPIKR